MKVRDVIRLVTTDGWFLERTKGDHRQFRHPKKPGTVTIAGHLSDDVDKGTLGSIYRQTGLKPRQRPEKGKK